MVERWGSQQKAIWTFSKRAGFKGKLNKDNIPQQGNLQHFINERQTIKIQLNSQGILGMLAEKPFLNWSID